MSCKDYAGFAAFGGVVLGVAVAGVLTWLFLRGLHALYADREDRAAMDG